MKVVAVQGFGAASVAFAMMGDERGDPISDCEVLAFIKHGDKTRTRFYGAPMHAHYRMVSLPE